MSSLAVATSGASLTSCFFFFNDPSTIEIYTLSLHDALPISSVITHPTDPNILYVGTVNGGIWMTPNRSEEHTSELQYSSISYAVFCLKKKNSARWRRRARRREAWSSRQPASRSTA